MTTTAAARTGLSTPWWRRACAPGCRWCRRARAAGCPASQAGDGNLHPLLVVPLGDEPARARAELAFEEVMSDALALGGTVTGEHGVGLLKRGGLGRELSPAVVAMQPAVKAALDPYGVLNPGKVLVPLEASA